VTLSFLRPDLPAAGAFAVAELPHRAKLDQNESPDDLPAELKQELSQAIAAEAWNRYPQPARYRAAKRAFARAVGIEPERLMLTFGGDQAILAAFWLAGGPGRRALILEPTYPMFAHYAQVTETPCERRVLGPEMRLEPAHLEGDFALRCLVSPNNPTGGRVAEERLAEALAAPGLLLLDEAYADFAGHSLCARAPAHPNLMIGRSLSKSLLAGIRLGWIVGHPELVAACESLFFAPYHLTSAQLVIAERYASIRPQVEQAAARVCAERARVAEALATRVPRVFPSEANFLLFEVPAASALAARLAGHGVRVRDVSRLPGLWSHLRVTLGAPAENDEFLTVLAQCYPRPAGD
jgi:histidinol-phosphate aminotransferase